MFEVEQLETNVQKRKELISQTLQNINLRNLVNIETLQTLQDNLASATGIAMVTVDYKGVPITKEASFSNFCQERRKITECKANCFFSDAYGSLKAAMTNSPYIYKCPVGLVDCAVPIIIEDNHIGGVLMGQVRCDEVETSSLEVVQNLVQNEIDLEENPKLKKLFYETEIISVSQLEKTGQLVKYLICEMVEKEITLRIQDELHDRIHNLQEEILNLKKEIAQSKSEMSISESCVSQFMLSSLTMLSTMAVTEGAEQTVEGISLYAKMLNKAYESNDGLVSIHAELGFVKKTVEILKNFFGHEIELKIDLDINSTAYLKEFYIPPFILYPLIENAVIHGIVSTERDGKINMRVSRKNESVVISIQDNGLGLEKECLANSTYSQQISKPRLSSLDIDTTRRRLESIFGREDLLTITPANEDEGVLIKVVIPNHS